MFSSFNFVYIFQGIIEELIVFGFFILCLRRNFTALDIVSYVLNSQIRTIITWFTHRWSLESYAQEYVRFWIWLTFRASLSDTGCTLRIDLLFFLVCFILVTSAGMAGTALLWISRFNLMLSVCSISMSLWKKLIKWCSNSLIKISRALGGNSFTKLVGYQK